MRARLSTPAGITRRRPSSREGLTQFVLSTLMLGRVPVGWNDRGKPTARGREYIARVDELAFGARWPEGHAMFVDEYELLARLAAEKTASPDHAVLWPTRVLVIELKTERGSHEPGQCERYLDLARHHNPGKHVDLIYLTGPMNLWTAEPGSLADGSRATHLQWANVLDVIEKVWGMDASDDERALAEFVGRLVADLCPRWNSERLVLEKELGIIPPSTLPIVMPSVPERIPDVASAVASDHRQRAVEVDADNPEQLDEARLQIADEIAASGIGGGHVRPWIWRAASSGGKPLTQLGRETGYEIRVSWYR